MRTIIITLVLAAALSTFAQAGDRATIRPLLGISNLAGAPSADDLGYVDADGGNLDNYLDQSKTSPYFGVQVLLPWKKQFFFGGELGFRRLFSSTFNTGSSDLSFINRDEDTDAEYDLSLLGIVEYRPAVSKFFVQGGIGFHVVRWEFSSDYDSRYSSSSNSYGGTGTNLGVMGAAGLRLPLTPKLTMPVMARFDYIMRYGAMLPLSISAGLEFDI